MAITLQPHSSSEVLLLFFGRKWGLFSRLEQREIRLPQGSLLCGTRAY